MLDTTAMNCSCEKKQAVAAVVRAIAGFIVRALDCCHSSYLGSERLDLRNLKTIASKVIRCDSADT